LSELGVPEPEEENSGINRVADNRLNAPGFTQQLRDFVYNDVPVFNIWDSIALIYSLAAEDVFCDERTSSPVSPGLGKFLVFLGIFLVFLAPSIGKSRRLGCQYLGYLGLLGRSYLSSL
jgi:hypothetical protein